MDPHNQNMDAGIEDDSGMITPLPEDNNPPFGAPTDPVSAIDTAAQARGGRIDPTHPASDSNIEDSELYDEGMAGADEAEEPNADNSVVDYDPESDVRKTA